jgi:putative cell wall-binding protein
VLKISGITYKVGATVGVGPIPYKVATNGGSDAFTTAQSNAVVSRVMAGSSRPQNLLPPSTTSTVPTFTIQEQQGGAIPAGGVCVTLVHPPTLAKFDTTAPPSVTATGGTGAGVPGAVVMSTDGLSFGFPTTASTAATTYTVRNLRVTSTAPATPAKTDLGPLDVDIRSGACATPGSLLAPGVRLGTIGFAVRVAGENRYATAAALAIQEGRFPTKTVVIARGDNFPDALAASYLAGQNHVPILLTRATSLPDETKAGLAAIGATDVIIVGGPGAVSAAVEDALKALPVYDATDQQHPVATNVNLTVARVGGVDRYDTARLVAERPGLDAGGTLGVRSSTGTCTPQATAILASGENFPDALAAGGLAFHGAGPDGCGAGPIPLLLTAPGSLSQPTAQALSDLKIKVVLLLGGTNAVSSAVENFIASAGLVVRRVGGDTRQDTAVMLNHDVLGNPDIGHWASGALLATRPDTFPDALAASSLSGGLLAPIYLTESGTDIGDTVIDGVLGYPTPAYAAFLLGGPAALSADVLTGFQVLLASQAG